MEERIRHRRLTFVPAAGWAVGERFVLGRDSIRTTGEGFWMGLKSPRSTGRFQLDTLKMPRDMPLDLAWLHRHVDARRTVHTRHVFGAVRDFDVLEWAERDVSCVAFSSVQKSGGSLRAWAGLDPSDPDSQPVQEVARRLKARPERGRRDWYLGRGTTLANIWFDSIELDTFAPDIIDCEAMVRSVEIDEGAGL